MALDGIAINNIVTDLNKLLLNGRIDKIYQPYKDLIVMGVRCGGVNHKLLISGSSSNPRVQLTSQKVENPLNPPLFCMVLRKHLTSGSIIKIEQPNFERIIIFTISSFDDMGDISEKRLIVEIMGKHSNIILVDKNDKILESAKHIYADKSAVRQVIPSNLYVDPPSQNKLNPLTLERDTFLSSLDKNSDLTMEKAIYSSYQGISPLSSSEIVYRAIKSYDLDLTKTLLSDISLDIKNTLYHEFEKLVDFIKLADYNPQVYFDEKGKVIDFSPFELTKFSDLNKDNFENISDLLTFYYEKKDKIERINSRTLDLKKLIKSNIDRCARKRDLQYQSLKDIKNRDQLKLYGELLTSYIYAIEKGSKSFTCDNFYDENYGEDGFNSSIEIPLDEQLTPPENAQKYFKQYNKEKRTYEATLIQIKENDIELKYLESMLENVGLCENEVDIDDIREELFESGYVKRKAKKNKMKTKNVSKPLTFTSSDDFDIYVGKNNKQNDELTLKFANNTDLWFHVKDIAGSHVIIRTNNQVVPESTISEAALLAAFYSKGKNSSNVPVDYTIVKNVKKPSGAKPGMVIYEKNKTLYITPTEKSVNNLKTD